MEEIEVPTEHLYETIEEKVEEAIKENEKGWSMYVAISTALIAVLAAISALLAGHHSDEAVMEQIKASDQWNYYQAKGIKAELKNLEISSGKATIADVAKYKSDQADIQKEAQGHEEEAEMHTQKHIKLSGAVTMFQIAIAISAISILTRKKILWYGSLALALGGSCFFIAGLLI
jgi:uncharacterized protein DUF4337